MEINRVRIFNNGVFHSLRKIQGAKTRLLLLKASNPTAAALASQIRLYEILLGEIRTISCSLEGGVGRRSSVRRHSVAARRNRGRHLIIPKSNPAIRSGQASK
jgi:hypothetical protein